jgi:hypothetical protein
MIVGGGGQSLCECAGHAQPGGRCNVGRRSGHRRPGLACETCGGEGAVFDPSGAKGAEAVLRDVPLPANFDIMTKEVPSRWICTT